MFPQFVRLFDELRYEPTGKRIRALVDGCTAVDTTGALVVWEPHRVVPTYAVPLVDIRHSSRQVRIERDGQVFAESTRPVLVFETFLPVRTYLPRADVRLELLEPSSSRTACAYKGVASYLARGDEDLAWSYDAPLPDAAELTDLVCFFDERVDVTVDGEKRARPVTPWSDRP